jgi:hypothetical protein
MFVLMITPALACWFKASSLDWYYQIGLKSRGTRDHVDANSLVSGSKFQLGLKVRAKGRSLLVGAPTVIAGGY